MKSLPSLVAALAVLWMVHANAQILNPKKLLQKKVEQKTNEAMKKTVDQAVDSALGTGQNNRAGNGNGNQEARPAQADKPEPVAKAAAYQAPSLEAYSKYDFIPGEKVVFFDDFTQDNVGDFPALWNTNGSGEVVTTNLYPGRWLKFSMRNCIWTDALLSLPDNYTVEFDVIPTKGEEGRMSGYAVRLLQSINVKAVDHGTVPGKAGLSFDVEYFGRPSYRTYINSDEGSNLGLNGFKDDQQLYQRLDQKYHIAIWVQKARVRIYQNENKLFDLPRAFSAGGVKMDRLRFEDGAAMISNVRIAAGLPDMRNKLLTDGKIVSYGIYFDVNKAEVKPESYGTLKEIAAVLSDNPQVKIRIVGHTDSDGADAANLDLSQRRAAAVKAELAKDFGIDPGRIETDGKGESQPVAANDTPANKALNRRVEFIKL